MAKNGVSRPCLRLPQSTIMEWSQQLVKEQADAVRLNGGWLNRPFRWGAHQHQVFLIRLGSNVFGTVKLGEAWCDVGNRWSNGMISLRKLEREHTEVFHLWQASDIRKAFNSVDKARALSTPPPAELFSCSLDLV